MNVIGSPRRVTVDAAYTPISPKLSKQSGPALSGGVAGVETFYLIELVTESGATYPLSKDTHDGACVPGNPSKGYVQVILVGRCMSTRCNSS